MRFRCVCVCVLQCQAVQDVAKAVSLFESTGRIPATVMEARYSHLSSSSVCGSRQENSWSCLRSQYFQEALLFDTIPPGSNGSKSGENIRRLSVILFDQLLMWRRMKSRALTRAAFILASFESWRSDDFYRSSEKVSAVEVQIKMFWPSFPKMMIIIIVSKYLFFVCFQSG